MNILIADDEAPARARLSAMLADISDYQQPIQVVAEVANGHAALEACEVHPVDLVLMDIRMPGMDGLQAAARLAECENRPAIIFTTAYDEHALQAFETQAVAYLLKPVRQEQLAEALSRASSINLAQVSAMGNRSAMQSQSGADPQLYLSASYRGGLQRIPLGDVFYLRADHKYVVVRHAGGEALIEESLKSLESRFPDQFFRIHRNALVARRQIKGLEKELDGHVFATFRGIDDRLEISRRHLPLVRRWLKK